MATAPYSPRSLVVPELHDACLYLGRGAGHHVAGVRPIAPIDTIQAQRSGSLHRPLHGRETHVMAPSDGAQRLSRTNITNNRFALACRAGFLRMLSLENFQHTESATTSGARGNCRSRGSQERFHRSLENPQNGFSTVTTGRLADPDQVSLT